MRIKLDIASGKLDTEGVDPADFKALFDHVLPAVLQLQLSALHRIVPLNSPEGEAADNVVCLPGGRGQGDGDSGDYEPFDENGNTNVPPDEVEPVGGVKAVLANMPKVSPEARSRAWKTWTDFCCAWAVGFDVDRAQQPDRLTLMRRVGSGRDVVPILIMAYEIGSLQRLVQTAVGLSDLDWCDRMAGTMVQISREGFPELAGTYDYSDKWRRELPSWQPPEAVGS